MAQRETDIKIGGRFWSTTTSGKIVDSSQVEGLSEELERKISTVGEQSIAGSLSLQKVGGEQGNLSVAGDLSVSGNLVVRGENVTVNQETIQVNDNIIVTNAYGAVTPYTGIVAVTGNTTNIVREGRYYFKPNLQSIYVDDDVQIACEVQFDNTIYSYIVNLNGSYGNFKPGLYLTTGEDIGHGKTTSILIYSYRDNRYEVSTSIPFIISKPILIGGEWGDSQQSRLFNTFFYQDSEEEQIFPYLIGEEAYATSIYNTEKHAIQLGVGYVTQRDDELYEFTFGGRENQSVATRSDDIVDGHFVVWDSINNILVDGGSPEQFATKEELSQFDIGLNIENGSGKDSLILSFSGETTQNDFQNTCNGESSIVFGRSNSIVGNSIGALLFGRKNTLNDGGNDSIIGGYGNSSSGNNNIIVGENLISTHNNVSLFGKGLTSSNNQQTILGQFNDSTKNADALIVVGGGDSDSTRKNVVAILKDGRIKVSGSPVDNDDLTNVSWVNTIVGGVIEEFNGVTESIGESLSTISDDVDTLKSRLDALGTESDLNISNGDKTGSLTAGQNNTINSDYSFAFGNNLITNKNYQFVVGEKNKQNASAYFIVGMNDQDNNAFEVLNDGRVTVYAAPKNNVDVVRKLELDTQVNGRSTRITSVNNIATTLSTQVGEISTSILDINGTLESFGERIDALESSSGGSSGGSGGVDESIIDAKIQELRTEIMGEIATLRQEFTNTLTRISNGTY